MEENQKAFSRTDALVKNCGASLRGSKDHNKNSIPGCHNTGGKEYRSVVIAFKNPRKGIRKRRVRRGRLAQCGTPDERNHPHTDYLTRMLFVHREERYPV